MAAQVTVHQAKTNLSKLLVRVEQGEEIVIARGSKPVAKLVRMGGSDKPRKLGGKEGEVWIADDFDKMSRDEFEMWKEAGVFDDTDSYEDIEREYDEANAKGWDEWLRRQGVTTVDEIIARYTRMALHDPAAGQAPSGVVEPAP